MQYFCGEAKGADLLGRRYGENVGYVVESFPAEWDKYGKRAGYIRNKAMADVADAVVAFWDGASEGTKHMIDIATEMNLPIRIKSY